MSDWIQKAKDFVKGNPEKAGQGLDKAEEFINERTGGKYADQLDQGTDKVREGLGLPPEAEGVPGTDPAPVDPTPADPGPTPRRSTRPPEIPPERRAARVSRTCPACPTQPARQRRGRHHARRAAAARPRSR